MERKPKEPAETLTFSTPGTALKAELPIHSTIAPEVSNIPALQDAWRDLGGDAELGAMDQQVNAFQRDATT